jgi:hypothetical protein
VRSPAHVSRAPPGWQTQRALRLPTHAVFVPKREKITKDF